jgi:hypothetical protein
MVLDFVILEFNRKSYEGEIEGISEPQKYFCIRVYFLSNLSMIKEKNIVYIHFYLTSCFSVK